MNHQQLIEKAQAGLHKRQLSSYDAEAAMVSCALTSINGNVYTGVSLFLHCGLGCCAEYNAIGTMITNNESEIKTIVAVGENGVIYPPCGRCREVMYQVNDNNKNTEVILAKDKVVKLSGLLPHFWYEK